ncbi:MAG: L,D-transpeptidase [Clostridia bacterium]|nr:L,D-transpeptidase [Clostridia bacterium]
MDNNTELIGSSRGLWLITLSRSFSERVHCLLHPASLLVWLSMWLLTSALVLLLFFLIALPWLQNLQPIFYAPQVNVASTPTDPEQSTAMMAMMEKDIAKQQKVLTSKMPRTNFLVINTRENKFTLRSGDQVLRTGFCSTGSYTLLVKSDNEKWAFQTPRGVLIVRGKTASPVWKKPDWAFVEEGLPVPSANHPSRYDYATLGDYALNLGNGYLIHGTLYQRLLGMPVTHGCIRLGDDDLEAVYKAMPAGSKVFIY